MNAAVDPARTRPYRYLGMAMLALVLAALPGGVWFALACAIWALLGDRLLGARAYLFEVLALCVVGWCWPLSAVAMLSCACAALASGAAQRGRFGLSVTAAILIAVVAVAAHWRSQEPPLVHSVSDLAAVALLGAFAVAFSLAGFHNVVRLQRAGLAQHDTIEHLARYLPAAVAQRLQRGPRQPPCLERRWLVVGFVDLNGFTEVAQALPVAELALLHNDFYCHLQTLCDATGATLCKTLGDGALVIWGDTSQTSAAVLVARAVRFCQRLHAAPPPLFARWQLSERRIGLRAGLAAGDCVLGDWGAQRLHYTVLGRCVNLAFRLQQHAAVGSTLVSAAVAQHMDPLPTERRRLQLKGLGRVVAYQV